MLALLVALSLGSEETTRDTLLSRAAATPSAGSARMIGAARVVGTDVGVEVSIVGALGARIAMTASVSWLREMFDPRLALVWQVLDQERYAINLSAWFGLRLLGNEGRGSIIDLRLALSRVWESFTVLGNVVIGKGIAGREDIDAEASFALSYAVAPDLRVGAEVEAHGELLDQVTTPEDHGRPVGVTAGPSLSLQVGAARLQLLCGATWPRGSGLMSPVARGTVTLDLR